MAAKKGQYRSYGDGPGQHSTVTLCRSPGGCPDGPYAPGLARPPRLRAGARRYHRLPGWNSVITENDPSRPASICPGRWCARHTLWIRRSAISHSPWHHRCVTRSDLEHLARTAYEAHRAAHPADLPPWDETTKQEQQAWKVAVSAIASQTGTTQMERASPVRSLVIQTGDKRHTFQADFTAGRQGNLP